MTDGMKNNHSSAGGILIGGSISHSTFEHNQGNQKQHIHEERERCFKSGSIANTIEGEGANRMAIVNRYSTIPLVEGDGCHKTSITVGGWIQLQVSH